MEDSNETTSFTIYSIYIINICNNCISVTVLTVELEITIFRNISTAYIKHYGLRIYGVV